LNCSAVYVLPRPAPVAAQTMRPRFAPGEQRGKLAACLGFEIARNFGQIDREAGLLVKLLAIAEHRLGDLLLVAGIALLAAELADRAGLPRRCAWPARTS